MKKGKIRKKVIAIALAVTMMLPSALSAVPVVNAAEKSTSENRTTEYLSDHLQEQKAEKAEALSENYWEKDAPKDAKEAAAMYVEDASDGKVTADNSGAGKEDENLEDLEVSTNQDAFDEHGLRETSHSVRVTYTIANEKYLKVDTIDDLFEKNTEAFLTSIVSTSPVYESKENDCYIAFLNYGKLNGLGSKIIDADFVTNTQMNPKDVKEDIVFDKKTGIVYIPKSYYFSVDGTELGYDLQSQILVCPDLNKPLSIHVEAENSSKAEMVLPQGTMKFSAFDTMTFPLISKETAGKISFEDIEVYVNDSALPLDLEEGAEAVYDSKTGAYTLNNPATTVYSVKIAVKGKSLAERIKNKFFPEVKAAKGVDGTTMSYVKNVDTNKPICPTIEYDKLEVGDVFEYDGGNSTHNFDLVKRMLKAGQKEFIYAPYLPSGTTKDIRTKFYNYMTTDEADGSAKSLNKLIDKLGSIVAAKDQNPSAGTDTGNVNPDRDVYYWYMFAIGAPYGTLKNVAGDKSVSFGKLSEWNWSDSFTEDGETKYRHDYAGMCCHIGDEIVDSKKKNQVAVLEKGDGYLVLGLAQTDKGSGADGQAGATIIKVMTSGDLKLKKTSANPGITGGNPCYSLQNAKYGIYTEEACTNQVGTLITDANGNTNTVSLPAKDYWVKEIEASPGYAKDMKAHKVTVKVGETVELPVTEIPTNDPATIEIFKIDQQSGEAVPEGGASLAGAQFTIKFYAGFYTKETLPKEPTRTWVIETKEAKDDNGKVHYIARSNNNYKVSGDEFYMSESGTVTFPLGTITVQETKAPEGYLLDGAYLQAKGGTEKIDDIYFSRIEEKGNVATLIGGNTYSMSDNVKRGDLSLIKIENSTQKRLANVPFKITSTKTKESHIAVTDKNGTFSTASSFNKHSSNTNGNDTFEKDGKSDSSYGIWFGLNETGENVPVDDSMGALPYDTYTIEELPCDANKGKKLISAFEVTIDREDYTVDLGTLTNDDKTNVLISKTDATTGEQVIGAKLELYKKVNGEWEKLAETITTKEIWKFSADEGDYKLVEILAPTGYMTAEAVEFTVDAGEVTKRVEMKDEPIEISGNIDKKQTLADGKDSYAYTIDYCSTSNTWADELNLTDPLDSVNAGYTRLTSIQTPVSFDDYDGKMNVWYQTNQNDKEDTADALKYNACSTNPDNPANPEKERMTDYTGWKLWKEGVSTLESTTLKVSDLKLAEDEYVTAFRFEHGRVEKGFTTRKNKANDGELDPEKSEQDNLSKVITPHKSTFHLKTAANPELQKDEELHYAPAVLQMEIISEDYKDGKAELVNHAEMNIFRDKGVTEKLRDDDSDQVVQKYEPQKKTKKTKTSSPSKPSQVIKRVQTGLKHNGGIFAAIAVLLAIAAVVIWKRKNRVIEDGKI